MVDVGKEPSFVINGILFGSVINDISVIFTELYCAVCHRIQLPKIRFRDAENREYDILVSDKDDRLGRRMLEIPMNIMSLKHLGVDVYTVKDGLLTLDLGDITGMLMLSMRYAMAEKSSSDTEMHINTI